MHGLGIRLKNGSVKGFDDGADGSGRSRLHYQGGGNFISTKSDTKNHGIGLQSVTRIVEAYGGVMEVLTERSVFQVNILM